MNSTPKPKIGIVGIGYLGGAAKYWFDRQNVGAFFYDKYKGIGSLQELNKAEIIFICLPTPFIAEERKGFDDSAIREVLESIEGEKIIVVKSTVLPGTTEGYQKKYPHHKFLMNPEFLVAKTAINDFLNPDRQIVGYTKESKNSAEYILSILPKSPFKKIVAATEAEMIKYFGNTFLANRVIFANQMFDLCQNLGINYDVVKECAGADTKALIQLSEKMGLDLELLKVIDGINEGLIKNSKNNNQIS